MRAYYVACLISLTLPTVGMAMLADQAVQGKKTDEERIVGNWVLVKGHEDGKEMHTSLLGLLRWTFAKDGRLTSWAGSDREHHLRYKLVDAGQIDLGPAKELDLGIYRFDNDDRVTICFNGSKEGKRPTEFASTDGSGRTLFVLERAKPFEKMTPEEKAKDAAFEKLRAAATRPISAGNLRIIASSFQKHHDTYECLPLHAIYSKDGKTPLLSWRVTILPYIEHDALYKQFKLDEPWDSEHNKTLIPLMPQVYASPVETKKKDGMTYYQVFTGPDTLFDGPKKITMKQIADGDGASDTIMVVEAGEPVIWTKPQDLELPQIKGKMPAVGGLYGDQMIVARCDGAVRLIRADLTPEILRALITPNGKEKIDWDKIDK